MRANVSSILSACIMIFLALSMFSCKPKSQSELYGSYVADYNVAKEKVTLNKDGTFIQEVALKATAKVDIAKGTWSYDPKSGYVSFEQNFMVVLDGFRKLDPNYAHPKPGGVDYPVDKYLGRILLGAAEGVLYKKID